MERKTEKRKKNPAKSHRLNQKQREKEEEIANFTKNTHKTLISRSFTTRACRGEKRRETQEQRLLEDERKRKKGRKYESEGMKKGKFIRTKGVNSEGQ
jgi:hypothetical protein